MIVGAAFALAFMLAGCSPKESSPTPSADYVFTNGVVYTVNSSLPEAEAVAITGNKISYVGSSEGASSLAGDSTQVIDLQGRMLLPGFVSAHDHLLTSGFLNLPLNLYGASNKQETLDLVRDYANANPDEAVIVGIGWSPAVMGGLPSKADLDAIVPERPVLLVEANTHEAWFNTAALKAANIQEDAADMLAPLYNMQVAMTLTDPSDPASKPFPDVRKRLTLEQALRTVTIDAARFMRMEQKVGSIEVGKLADLVVLDQDIRKVAADKLKDVKVQATMMDGVFRYREQPIK